MPGQFLATGGKLLVDTGGGTFTSVGNVIEYDSGRIERTRVQVSNLDSTSHEYRGGLGDVPAAEVSFHLDPANAQHQTLYADITAASDQLKGYRLQLGSGATPYLGGSAYVSAFGLTGGLDAPVVISAAFQWSVAPSAVWS